MYFKKSLDFILFSILGFIPFITFVQFDETIYPYVTSKHFTFRFAILFAATIWIALGLLDRSLRPRISNLLKSFLIFMAVVFLADLFGSNFWNSFWSNYSRMEGFISLLFFLLFFLVLSSTFNNSERWRNYWLIHVLVSIVVLIFAIMQKMRLILAVDFNRVDSVFGNSSYLAIYASMIFFLCLFLFFTYTSRWLKALIIFAAICNLGSIYLSQTRSATLGVLVGFVFFIFSLARNKKNAMAFSIGICIFFFASVFIFKNRSSGVSTNLFERIAHISMQDSSVQARVEIWKYCLRAFVEQPFLGWGQENYLYLASFYSPQLWATPWADRAHNIFLQWGIDAGVLGVLALLSVLFFLLKGIWQADESKLTRSQKVALLGFLFCWFINQSLSIDFFSISILFYSLLAFVHSLGLKEQSNDLPLDPVGWKVKVLGTCIIIGFGLKFNFFLNAGGLLKNMEIHSFTRPENIIRLGQSKNYEEQIELILKSARSNELREFRSLLIQNALLVLNQFQLHKTSEDYAQTYYKIADREIQKQMQDDPNALYFKHTAANFYTQFQNFHMANKLFDEILSKVPQQQYFLIDFGHLQLAQGKLFEGLSLYRKAFELEQNYGMAKMYLALGYVYNRNFVQGNLLTDEMIKLNQPEVFDERLINAYLATGHKGKAQEIMVFRSKFLGVENR